MENPTGPYQDMSIDEQLLHAVAHLSRMQFLSMHEVRDKLKLYPGQPQLLGFLWKIEQAGGAMPSQRELAKYLKIRPATLTVTLQRMETAGLIVRKPDASDARVQRVALTEDGRERLSAFQSNFRLNAKHIFADMPREKKEKLFRDIEELTEYLANRLPSHDNKEE